MNNFMEQFKNFTKHVSEEVKEIFKHESVEAISLNNFSSFVITHPNSRKIEQEMLDLTFNTYHLTINPYHVRLETKGKRNEQVLELTIWTTESTIITFDGYEHEGPVGEEIIHIPKSVYDALMKSQSDQLLH